MNKMTMEQGLKEIMAIIEGNGGVEIEKVAGAGGAHSNSTKSTKSAKSAKSAKPTNSTVVDPSPVKVVDEVTYDGYGHVVSKGGKKTHTGYVKHAKRVKSPSDDLKSNLMDACEVLLNNTVAFAGKVGRNKVDGIILRLSDADYTVKIAGHAKREFENREPNFVAEKSYLTRGKAENHSPAIAKIIANEFQNQNPCASFGGFEIEGLFTLLSSKAAGVRFEIQKSDMVAEFTFKITKKRARVVFE